MKHETIVCSSFFLSFWFVLSFCLGIFAARYLLFFGNLGRAPASPRALNFFFLFYFILLLLLYFFFWIAHMFFLYACYYCAIIAAWLILRNWKIGQSSRWPEGVFMIFFLNCTYVFSFRLLLLCDHSSWLFLRGVWRLGVQAMNSLTFSLIWRLGISCRASTFS